MVNQNKIFSFKIKHPAKNVSPSDVGGRVIVVVVFFFFFFFLN